MKNSEELPLTYSGASFKRWLESTSPTLSWFSRKLVWSLDPRARRSRCQLSALQNQHLGQRCFIIGNGPSLAMMDLTLLSSEFTFSLNRGYLYYDRVGKPCTYHVVVNPLVVEQWADEIAALPNTKFVTWSRRHWLPDQDDIVYFGGPVRSNQPRFCLDVRKDIWSGATVTYAALQLAYFLGFSKVILIGVDHRFEAKGDPHQTVTSSGDDLNHFDPDYFGKGVRWQLPDLETSEVAYRLSRQYFHSDGREILDATVDGALTVFPKVDYESMFT